MIFGIDYDGTFSADPDAFRELVRGLKARGHICVLVTGRSDEGGWGDVVRMDVGDLMPIVFAANKWKEKAALARGFKVNVWIDDNPESIRPANVQMVEMRQRATGR